MDKHDRKFMELLFKLCLARYEEESAADVQFTYPHYRHRLRIMDKVVKYEKLLNKMREKFEVPNNIEEIVEVGKTFIEGAMNAKVNPVE